MSSHSSSSALTGPLAFFGTPFGKAHTLSSAPPCLASSALLIKGCTTQLEVSLCAPSSCLYLWCRHSPPGLIRLIPRTSRHCFLEAGFAGGTTLRNGLEELQVLVRSPASRARCRRLGSLAGSVIARRHVAFVLAHATAAGPRTHAARFLLRRFSEAVERSGSLSGLWLIRDM